jgi:microcystin-dependent protein
MWPTTTPPTGWLLCEGNTFDPVAYPELSALLGGATVTPDFKDRVPVGRSSTKLIRSVNSIAANLVSLLASHMPPHTHTTPNHTHPYLLVGGNDLRWADDAYASGTVAGLAGSGEQPASIASGGAGTSGAGPNATTSTQAKVDVQNPYLAVCFIIKAVTT